MAARGKKVRETKLANQRCTALAPTSTSFTASNSAEEPKLLTSDKHLKRLRIAETQNGILRAQLWKKEEQRGHLRVEITWLKRETISERQSCSALCPLPVVIMALLPPSVLSCVLRSLTVLHKTHLCSMSGFG